MVATGRRTADDRALLRVLGRSVRANRQALGLSQEELADRAKLHRTYVGGIERGERNVSLLNVVKLAAGLEMSASELLARLD